MPRLLPFLVLLFSLRLEVCAQTVTYHADVAPIIHNHCTGCHRPGEIAPMPFTSFSEVQAYGEFIAYVTSSKPKPGIERILLPGEPERVTEEARRRDGIPLDEETWRQVNQVAAELGVEIAPAR